MGRMKGPDGDELCCLWDHDYHMCGASTEAPCCRDGSAPVHGSRSSAGSGACGQTAETQPISATQQNAAVDKMGATTTIAELTVSNAVDTVDTLKMQASTGKSQSTTTSTTTVASKPV